MALQRTPAYRKNKASGITLLPKKNIGCAEPAVPLRVA